MRVDWIKRMAKSQKITQDDLAKAVGISKIALNRKLNRKAPITIDEAVKLLWTVGVNSPETICEVCEFRENVKDWSADE